MMNRLQNVTYGRQIFKSGKSPFTGGTVHFLHSHCLHSFPYIGTARGGLYNLYEIDSEWDIFTRGFKRKPPCIGGMELVSLSCNRVFISAESVGRG